MNPMRELTWQERQFVALVVGGIPALIIGLNLGLLGIGIGGRELDLGTVLLRGAYCAVFPIFLACLMPRYWVLPAMAYLIGFNMSFGIADGFAGFAELIMAPARWIEGKRVSIPPSSHPDRLWIFGIALWLTGLVAILR